MTWPLSIDDIRMAEAVVRPHIHRTPVLTSNSLNALTGGELFFKCENFQKVGAFKIRGATNAVLSLSDENAAQGVATHSSGNHAAAVALAATFRPVPAYVVMPETTPEVKKRAVAGYGAKITYCEPTLEAREATFAQVQEETGAALIHPYNDPTVIAGQATAGLELLEDASNLDVIVIPVGGGGLASGIAMAVSYLSPATRVIGVEPAMADDARRSLEAGRIIPSEYPATIADGLRTSLGRLAFEVLSEKLEAIVTVDESAIAIAMRTIWERMKIVIEPSAAVTFAAIQTGAINVSGKNVGVIFSGGNVDLDSLPWLAS